MVNKQDVVLTAKSADPKVIISMMRKNTKNSKCHCT